MTNKKTRLLNAAMAGLLAAGGAAILTSTSVHAAGDHCYGVNGCKGTGECGGKGHSCSGKNTCKGQGWISMNKEDCLKKGGSLEPKAEEKKDEKKAPTKS